MRFVSNRSSGKMGYAVAAAARARGHDVCLVSGPVALAPPPGADVVRVRTAAEMLAAVQRRVRGCDLLVMAAAPADWRPRRAAKHKLKKRAGPPRIAWEAAPDILQTLAPRKKPAQVFCGFAAETRGLAREAQRKLRAKNLDAIAANDVSKNDRGFEADRNALTVFCADGRTVHLPLAAKTVCARRLVRLLEKISREKKSKNFPKNS